MIHVQLVIFGYLDAMRSLSPNSVHYISARWQGWAQGTGLFVIALLFLGPAVSVVYYDGIMQDILLVAALSIPSLYLFWAGIKFGIRKVIHPDELVITPSGLLFTRYGHINYYPWHELSEPTQGGGSGLSGPLLLLRIAPYGTKLLVQPSNFSSTYVEMAKDIGDARKGISQSSPTVDADRR